MPQQPCGTCGEELYISERDRDDGAEVYCEPSCPQTLFNEMKEACMFASNALEGSRSGSIGHLAWMRIEAVLAKVEKP